MDHWMPEIDGAEATRKILSDGAGGTPLQIIMVTGFATEVVRQAAEAAGAVGFLTKPVTLSSLYDMLVGTFAGGGKARSALPEAAAPNLTGIRVLLVEDNAVNQMLARRLLERLGATVSIADNGLAAIEKLQQGSFDVVLMDCQMPELDGYEATQRIRAGAAGEPARTIPIIALTANALSGDRERCLEAGMNDYLAKPINPTVLRTKLEGALKLDTPPAAVVSG
jgi:CheY-like chemotaxis protein